MHGLKMLAAEDTPFIDDVGLFATFLSFTPSMDQLSCFLIFPPAWQ